MNLNNVLAKAQRMMLDEDWNRQVEIGAAAQRAGSINGNKGYDPAIAAMEQAAFGTTSMQPSTTGYEKNPIPSNYAPSYQHGQYGQSSPVQIIQEQASAPSQMNSKLPKSILESFERMPSPIPAEGAPTSVLEGLQLEQYPQSQPGKRAPVGAGIDYNYIKYLIDESIERHMKGSLNEGINLSDIKGMRIANGSVIQFIDTKGNLYEGKLTLKKKVK